MISRMNHSKYIPIFFHAAFRAGRKILEIYNSNDFEVKLKSDNSPLTQADIESHTLIKKTLMEALPRLPLMSEEEITIAYNQRKKWKEYICIDPLDGTKEFINRNGEFTINIALIRDCKPVIGVIYCPLQDILYFGGFDTGSFKIHRFSKIFSKFSSTSLPYEHIVQLPCADRNRKFTVVGSRSHMNDKTQNFINELRIKYGKIDILSAGSSLKFCVVAEGSADVYPRFAPTMEWDTAAGQGILEGAGGAVYESTKEMPLKYNKPNLKNPSFIAKGFSYI
jgi:3'(2'), 5'-bisphosphate nucleotidase